MRRRQDAHSDLSEAHDVKSTPNGNNDRSSYQAISERYPFSSQDSKSPRRRVAGESEQDGKKTRVLRISFLVPRDAIPRLEWMMDVADVPTKVDLLRAALNHYERHLIDQEAEIAEKRRIAGAPPKAQDRT